MRNTPPNRHRNNRSNAYSESKCSNWAWFQPYHSELYQVHWDDRPTRVMVLAEGVEIPIFERPLHPSFVRPYTLDDVEEVLRGVPSRFLTGLERIVLLGGTQKQERAYRGNFSYGFYHVGRQVIALCAYPQKYMKEKCHHAPPPHVQQEYRLAGAKTYMEGRYWVCEFDEAGLRKFLLHDTLIHEIGHHVDRLRRGPHGDLTEAFAEWFARTYGYGKNVAKS